MFSEQAFLESLGANPTDRIRRLIFVDFLEDQDDPRAELLRLTDRLTQSINIPNRPAQENRLRQLLALGVQPVGPYFTNRIGMRFVWIPAGTFQMGSEEWGEMPHPVTLTQGFYLGVFPVTQQQWLEVMGTQPSHFQADPNLPVETVSWEDCQIFLRRLGSDGIPYRLPTEAEWEYACRGGTSSDYYFGNTITIKQVNFAGEGLKRFHDKQSSIVGAFPHNAFGLHDMHGNVFEWCWDWWGEYPAWDVGDPDGPAEGEVKVLRGGSWDASAHECRSFARNFSEPDFSNYTIGFRVCFWYS